MQRPSLTLILSGIFLGYVVYAIFGIAQLFMPPVCDKNEPCLKSFLHENPKLQVHTFISPNTKAGQVHHLHSLNLNYKTPLSMPLVVELPSKTRQNGTLFLHIIIVPESSKGLEQSFNHLQQNPHMVYTRVKLTQFAVPVAQTFNLLGEKKENKESVKRNYAVPVSHLRSSITFTLVTDAKELPSTKVPYEIKHSISVTNDGYFLPIVDYDFLQTRLKDLVEINPNDRLMNLTLNYVPISMGHFRLIQHLKGTMEAFKGLGFSAKDIDDIKGIYADTNFYLLAATMFIASMHFLFDFLSFKNDVNFWRTRSSFEGLSVSSIIWRGFSQSVIFLYLLDERSSMLILIPAGIGTLIEMWKIKKVLRLKISRSNGIFPSINYENKNSRNDETQTRKFDAEFMRYLSYLLYPLVIGGAVYSLIYQPHKSWYSWTINSMVNGVYAFGFLFMLPQLFVNYKLKSVAHLPWRAFMYKAFNTFIDDVFAFIITMPTAHRVACFRDDIIFLGYLYQRWLYPVDKSRIDSGTIVEEPTTKTITSKKLSEKKKK